MAETMTITEALAQLPLAKKKMDGAQDNVLRYIARPDDKKDPLEKDGGSAEYIQSQIQSFEDNLSRVVRIRQAIARANTENTVKITSAALQKSYEKTIEGWLIWKREVYPAQRAMYKRMIEKIENERKGDYVELTGLDRYYAERRGGVKQTEYPGKTDITVEFNEKELNTLIEGLEEVFGLVDGRLTLVNSTVEVTF